MSILAVSTPGGVAGRATMSAPTRDLWAPGPGWPPAVAPAALAPGDRLQALRPSNRTDAALAAVAAWEPTEGEYCLDDVDARIMPEIRLRLPELSWKEDGPYHAYKTVRWSPDEAERRRNASSPAPASDFSVRGDPPEVALAPVVTLRAALWGQLAWPADAGGRAPLAVLAHGFKEPCADIYDTEEITCALYAVRDPHCVPTPSHLGYAYLAEALTARGFVVLSINVNAVACRGFGSDEGNRAANIASRGAAVLANVALLQRWDAGERAPEAVHWPRPQRIDFADVHLVGHSRGAEGMRAAVAQLRQGTGWRALPGVTVRSLFEIAPTSSDISASLQYLGLPAAAMVPLCDGDAFNLEGLRHFDRALAAPAGAADSSLKAALLVHGGRHNTANTVWTEMGEDGTCHDAWESSPQADRDIVAASVRALFDGHRRGGDRQTAEQFFDPRFALPPALTHLTRVDRAYVRAPGASATLRLSGPPAQVGAAQGLVASFGPLAHNEPDTHLNVTGIRLAIHDVAAAYCEHTWSPPGEGLPVAAWESLSLRMGRYNVTDGAPLYQPTQVRLELMGPASELSPGLLLAAEACPVGPVKIVFYRTEPTHFVLQTLSASLDDMPDRPARARGVRLSFAGPAGTLGLTDVLATYRERP